LVVCEVRMGENRKLEEKIGGKRLGRVDEEKK
jgi:hypothetical protein